MRNREVSIKQAGICFAAFAAVAMLHQTATFAEEPLFLPASGFGTVSATLPQSLARVGQAMDHRSTNFEVLGRFTNQSPYRILSEPVGLLDILVTSRADGREGRTFCTAWLVEGDHVVTNEHCLHGEHSYRIRQAELRLGFHDFRQGVGESFPVDITPVESDETLDYAIFKVRGQPGQKYGVIRIRPRDPEDGEELFVLHHPLGRPLRLTRRQCRAIVSPATRREDIGHTCDTLPGSSGAPVFSDNTMELVGLHYGGGLSDPTDTFNSGVRLSSIVRDSKILGDIWRKEQQSNGLANLNPSKFSCSAVSQGFQDFCNKAKLGDLAAQLVLVNEFYRVNSPPDLQISVYWTIVGAESGNRALQGRLGYLYEKGYGVPRDLEKFVLWTRKAAEQGEPVAQYNLGEAYDLGIGVPIDRELAEFWYRRALRQGFEPENVNERLRYLYGSSGDFIRVGRRYLDAGDATPPDDLSNLYNDAAYWFQKAADAGSAEGTMLLGYMYDTGKGLKKDEGRALNLFLRAAKAGDATAMYNLGIYLQYGRGGLEADLWAAKDWYRQSARAGFSLAEERLQELQ